jgi:REP element-mobilizing transposase RayT
MTGKIILLTDIYEVRKRKEEELAYYHEQLEKLKEKMHFVQKEIVITNYIIDIIEQEKVVDIKKYIKEKKSE